MSNDTSGAVASNAELGLLCRLRSLKVLLGTDSPEVRGWAPAVRQQAEKTINAALVGFADLNATLANLEATTLNVANENERLRAALEGLLRIHTEPSGFSGKYGKELTAAIDAQQIKINARVAAANAALGIGPNTQTTGRRSGASPGSAS